LQHAPEVQNNKPTDDGMPRHVGRFKKIQHHLEKWIVEALIATARIVPLTALRRFGAGLGWFAFRIVGIRRDIVLANLHASLPDCDDREVHDIAQRSYMNWGRSTMEFAAQRHLSKENILDMVTLDGIESFDEALDCGRGAVLITAHLGNWELLAAAVAQCGYPVHVTDTDHSNPIVHRIIDELRERHQVKLISPRQPVRYLLKLLESNQFVAYLPDQDARGSGVFVEFFGRPAWTLRAPAVFAMRRGCPVVTGFLVREGNDNHRAIFGRALWPDRNLKGEEAVVELTQRITRIIEDMVRQYPEQYFWVHRRWKTQPEKTTAV
jgi:KDO2-lipid IV(A) lauroyltransferase